MKLVKIVWETDGCDPEELGLPAMVNVPDQIEVEDIADWLSDDYGFLVDRLQCLDIDWEKVLDEQNSLLRDAMLKDMAWTLDGADSSPYTFEIFDLQERIGCIEKEDYMQAYSLLMLEYGEQYFEDFIL